MILRVGVAVVSVFVTTIISQTDWVVNDLTIPITDDDSDYDSIRRATTERSWLSNELLLLIAGNRATIVALAAEQTTNSDRILGRTTSAACLVRLAHTATTMRASWMVLTSAMRHVVSSTANQTLRRFGCRNGTMGHRRADTVQRLRGNDRHKRGNTVSARV